MGTNRIGIDLGTTHSTVSVFQNGKVQVVPNDDGSNIMPSCVAFTEDGGQLVGDEAKARATIEPENMIYGAKRLIGRRIDEPSVQADIDQLTYNINCNEEFPKVEVEQNGETKIISPEEISAMVVAKMKENAENFLGAKVDSAVITVPANFTDFQRQATIKAAQLAGIDDIRILNEPTAAAIAYGITKEDIRGNVLVYDLGGGTLDVSIVSITDTDFTVKSTNGNTHLGGEDFTNNLVDYVVDKFKRENGVDIKTDKRATARLRQECESKKKALSFQKEVMLEVDAIIDDIDVSEHVSRGKFEDLNEDLFKSTINFIQSALDSATLTKEDIDKVVMVGGSSRIPKIQELVKEFFIPIEVHMSINPDEAIGYGAAAYAAIIDNVHLKGSDNFTIQDIIPMSLGIELDEAKAMSVIIPKNSAVPISETRRYETVQDNVPEVYLRVFEGEDSCTLENNYLGEFTLEVPPAPKGVEKLDVTFSIEANGTLKVTAKNLSTGNLKNIDIDRRSSRATTLS